jgi:predicted enzyme related to lactoylglutathione lyase
VLGSGAPSIFGDAYDFRVVAIAAVNAGGGEIITQLTTPDGARIAVCHDPQGAIFALRESGTDPAADPRGRGIDSTTA